MATIAGVSAIIMWSALALLTAGSGFIPPFQLLAITAGIGGVAGLASWLIRPPQTHWYRQPVIVWLTGIAGIFGYHFFYYTALRNAPVAEAGLIAYLWPLLIVLFSAFLPGEKLRKYHLLGALIGFAGAALLIISSSPLDQNGPSNFFGYLSAFICAFIWSTYSVISRLFKHAPTDVVIVYCLVTSLLAAICHFAFETSVWPTALPQWIATILLGLFPVGLAFYVWDYAMKNGPIQLIGSLAYAAPVLSTAILVIAGQTNLSWQLFTAAIMVTMGAVIASGKIKDLR